MSAGIMKQLMEAGAHFGHKTRKWNPRMAPFIYTKRNGIHIINLQKTVVQLTEACRLLKQVAEDGGKVLFVGTKKQAKETIVEAAQYCGGYYVSERWLGGMLTNYETIRLSVSKLARIEEMEADGTIHLRPKKEVIKLRKTAEKLEKYLAGIKSMLVLPKALVVVDPLKEIIAIREAKVLGIPVVGMVDTNCNPDVVDICIPSNDDSFKATQLILNSLAAAVRQGADVYDAAVAAQRAEEEAKAAALAKKKAEQEAAKKAAEAKAKEDAKKKAAQEQAEQAQEGTASASDSEPVQAKSDSE